MEALVLEGARLLFSERGAGWIVAVLLGCALYLRDRQYGECLKAQVELAKQMATALERSSTTNAAVAASLDSRTGVFEHLNERVGALSHHVEASTRGLSERVTDNGRALNEIREAVGDIRLDLSRVCKS